MKLENQVVPIEQAKRLKELGVNAPSIFLWYKANNGYEVVYNEDLVDFDTNFSAYGVAELGVMFGIGTRATDWLVNTMCRPSKTVMWNPYFLAKCLIEALETGITTAAEVNERLKNA